jgi:selenocysteine lyase/cysteine desulfurase
LRKQLLAEPVNFWQEPFMKKHRSDTSPSASDIFARLRAGIIGQDYVLAGPFGPRKLVYADYVASGRAYGPIEDAIREQVLPLYANTHTEASATGRQSSSFREQARAIISTSVGASKEDAVLFCGSGCTGAVDRLIQLLGLKVPHGLRTYGLHREIEPHLRPVVFIGPYEHHSNDVQWRETIADVITIAETKDGLLDMEDLRLQLQTYQDRPLKVGSFSTASNVTGIRTEPVPVAKLLHEFGALAAFDFAASAPYVRVDMNGEDGAHFDAIYLSPHKFLGGPGTPGVLVVKKKWARNKTPVIPGGGTVSYVSPCAQAYLTDVVHREEGGTPEIVGSIRAGLVFALKEQIGDTAISKAESGFAEQALARWGQHPNIRILGSQTAPRLPVFSFLIRAQDKYLHYNFVVALLDDLFGIQARGGCSCAGPYGHRLLGIDLATSREYEEVIKTGLEVLKPGWVRLGFNYFFSKQEAELILRAVEWIADHGIKLLPLYQFEMASGRWMNKDRSGEALLDLTDLPPIRPVIEPPPELAQLLALADRQIEVAAQMPNGKPCPELQGLAEHLHWFCEAPKT